MELVDNILSLNIAPNKRRNGQKSTGASPQRKRNPKNAANAALVEALNGLSFQQPQADSSGNSVQIAVPEYRQFLETCYSTVQLDLLSIEQQQQLYQDLQVRPLLLCLVQLQPCLNLLSFECYTRALNTFHPQVQQLERPLFDLAREFTEKAAFYSHSGYRLHASEVIVPNTPNRQILKVALQEAGIGFNVRGELEWPLFQLTCERVQQTLISVLPRTSHQLAERAMQLAATPLTPNERMDFFERIINQPGTWSIQFTEYCARHNALEQQSRMLNSLLEDQYVCINMSLPCQPGILLKALDTAVRVCFFFCNPIPLSFWCLVAARLSSSIRTVLFMFEPYKAKTPLQDLLELAAIPRLELQLMAATPAGFRPEFDWDDGLLSQVFLRQSYWQPHFLTHLEELPSSRADLPPLASIDPRHYVDVIKLLCSLIIEGTSVKFLTGTWAEAERIWSDCVHLLKMSVGGMSTGWFTNQQVNLLGDPLSSELRLTKIGENGVQCELQMGDEQPLGNNFILAEIQQSYVAPLSSLIHRHHNVLFYYSAVRPLDSDALYQLTNAAYQNVLIVASAEARGIYF